jgi:threonine/homoserine/homoserine lactone efflux protein
MDPSLLTFLAISAVVIATPGPDTALTIRNTFLGGWRGGIGTALGVSTGQLVWAAAASLGVLALLLASEPIFRGLKLLGAAYLVYLGIQSLHSALRGSSLGGLHPPRGGRSRLGGFIAFRQGVINNLANPKMAVFFASVLPQFAPPGQGMLSALLMLGLLFATLTFLWLTLYAVSISVAGEFFLGFRLRRVIEGAAGAALVGLGVKVATEDL